MPSASPSATTTIRTSSSSEPDADDPRSKGLVRFVLGSRLALVRGGVGGRGVGFAFGGGVALGGGSGLWGRVAGGIGGGGGIRIRVGIRLNDRLVGSIGQRLLVDGLPRHLVVRGGGSLGGGI